MERFDLIVLGGGPAGYVAAAEYGKAGKRVLLVEMSHPGGVCLNVGCIPTKTLLHSSKFVKHLRSSDVHGVAVADYSVDWPAALAWKDQVIGNYRKGVLALLKAGKVTVVEGRGRLTDRSTVEVGGVSCQGDAVMIATGSRSAMPPIPGLKDNPRVVDSTGLLALTEIPSRLVVIGGGVIGLEFAALYAQLGASVTVLEMLDTVAPLLEPEIRKTLLRSFKDIDIHTGAKVVGVEGSAVSFEKGGVVHSVEADVVLVATGRRANIEDIGLEEAKVKTSRGYVLVNDRMETSAPRVYAIGDVVGTSLFAHSASRMAEVAVRVLLGERTASMSYAAIPWAVYTWPEVAGCGLTEQDARAKGIDVLVTQVPMRLSARYYAENGDIPGLVKVVVRKEDRVLLGVQMVGGGCSEMIWGATMAVQLGLTAAQVAETIFAHPTVSEVLRDALLQVAL